MATDICEPQIIRALKKDGWEIVQKPYTIRTGGKTILADFSVGRVVDDRFEQIIVMEVKCFSHPKNDLQELYTAVGQFEAYESEMSLTSEYYPVYLAIPFKAYERLLRQPFFPVLLKRAQVKLLIVDIDKEEIVQWLS